MVPGRRLLSSAADADPSTVTWDGMEQVLWDRLAPARAQGSGWRTLVFQAAPWPVLASLGVLAPAASTSWLGSALSPP